MNWHIDASGVPIKTNGMEPGSAADADEDIAWALIQAADQWSTASYRDDAKRVINAMSNYEVGGDGLFKPGDNWGSTDQHTFPDYFSPAYFRRFAAVTGDNNWNTTILDRNYEVIAKVGGTNGLVPDETTGTYMNTVDKYGYDACRTPWRIGMDYCFNNEPRALAYLMKIGAFFDAKGVDNIVDGYVVSTSTASGNNKNMAFIGPAGIAGMPSSGGFPKLLDDAFSFGAKTTSSDYFKDSLRVITMLMMSGNLLDLSIK
jgi:endo-1,4-beta-D-glucanase Y